MSLSNQSINLTNSDDISPQEGQLSMSINETILSTLIPLRSTINFTNLIVTLTIIATVYIVRKLIPVIIMFNKIKYLPQTPSNWLMGHSGNLLPPPFTSSKQFGKDLKSCVDKLDSFLYQNGLMVFWFTWFPIIIITNHDILKKLTSATIEKGPGSDVAREFFGDGLVMQNFSKWKGRRKLLTPFYNISALANYLPAIAKVARDRVRSLKEEINDQPVDTRKFTQETGMDMTCEITLGIESGTKGSPSWQYRKAIDVALEMMLIKAINPLYWFDFIFKWTVDGKRTQQAAEYIRSFPSSLISSKKLTHIPGSFNPKVYNPEVRFSLLDCLIDLHLKSESGKNSFEFTTLDILEETNTLFAGNETTAGAMAWTMFHLADNPEIQDKVYEELIDNGFTGQESPDYTEDGLKSLKYLEWCVKESLRICPPIHTFTRQLDEDIITDDGQILPKGSVLALCVYYIHHDPAYWPEPEKFIPERFTPELCANRSSFAYVPFGFGQRQCIGQKLAMREITVFIAEVIRHFHLVNCEPFENIETAFMGSFRAIESLKIKFIPRSQ